MASVSIHTPNHVATPRGATLAAGVMAALLHAIEKIGQWRAVSAARRSEASRVRDASKLRRYAYQFLGDDPRFAADLLAAADRHELTE